MEKICCACSITGFNFNKLSSKEENNLTLLAKLKTCIQEVEWTPSLYICVECTSLLNTCYSFYQTCLNSNLRKKEQEEVLAAEHAFVEDVDEITEIDSEGEETNDSDAVRVLGQIKGEIHADVKDENYSEDVDNTKEIVAHFIESNQENEESCSEFEKVKCKWKKKGSETGRKSEKRKKLKFGCEKCEVNFSASTKLVDHCVREHGMELKDVKPFVCDRCPQRFSTSSNLWQHIKYHDGIKSKMCSYCGKGFITKTDLVNHEKKHLNMREYKCEACGKSFNTHKDIRSHKLIVHTDSSKWKFVCEICNKPFPIKSNYDSHMRRHTGDKKFACHLCEKKFTTKCDLQRHTRSHSHVREHRCQHCEKEYKDERVLKVHMAKIHAIGVGKVKIPVRERKHACHFCPKAYYAKNKLTRHIYTHSGEKPFHCPICEKKFNDKSYVKQHLRNTHNVEQQDTLENELKIKYLDNSTSMEIGLVSNY